MKRPDILGPRHYILYSEFYFLCFSSFLALKMGIMFTEKVYTINPTNNLTDNIHAQENKARPTKDTPRLP